MFGHNDFSAEKACELLARGALLVDVRSEAEFAKGALPKAFNLPLPRIDQATDLLDKNRDIILYCVSGARSSNAKIRLLQMGFSKVHDLGAFANYKC